MFSCLHFKERKKKERQWSRFLLRRLIRAQRRVITLLHRLHAGVEEVKDEEGKYWFGTGRGGERDFSFPLLFLPSFPVTLASLSLPPFVSSSLLSSFPLLFTHCFFPFIPLSCIIISLPFPASSLIVSFPYLFFPLVSPPLFLCFLSSYPPNLISPFSFLSLYPFLPSFFIFSFPHVSPLVVVYNFLPYLVGSLLPILPLFSLISSGVLTSSLSSCVLSPCLLISLLLLSFFIPLVSLLFPSLGSSL